jgi:hypothetical protein
MQPSTQRSWTSHHIEGYCIQFFVLILSVIECFSFRWVHVHCISHNYIRIETHRFLLFCRALYYTLNMGPYRALVVPRPFQTIIVEQIYFLWVKCWIPFLREEKYNLECLHKTTCKRLFPRRNWTTSMFPEIYFLKFHDLIYLQEMYFFC